MKTICIITGTRAEYGLLKPVMQKIQNDKDLVLKLVVTGMHLCPEFGNTYKEIENDKILIDEKIEINLSSDTKEGMVKSTGIAMISFSDYFKRNKPDMLIILGDRYEIFAAASSAAMMQIPIAHLCGGDLTEGLVDEFIRHSITKMSYLHFTTTDIYKKRVEQLGEHPDRVFNVGSVGVENIMNIKLMSIDELEKSINFKIDKKYALVTFHPVTLEDDSSEWQFKELLKAIDSFKNMKFIFTKANSDANGRIINKMIDTYINKNENCIAFTSLGILRYLSLMKYAKMVVGNSSSGIYETPSFKIPTINIGDRQKGRLQAKSIINCEPISKDIIKAMQLANTEEFINEIKNTINPYGNGNASIQIVDKIKEFLLEDKINLKKKFYDVKWNI